MIYILFLSNAQNVIRKLQVYRKMGIQKPYEQLEFCKNYFTWLKFCNWHNQIYCFRLNFMLVLYLKTARCYSVKFVLSYIS